MNIHFHPGHPSQFTSSSSPETGAPTARLNGTPVMQAQWSRAVSRNPYLQFRIKGAKAGDEVSISWIDNQGETNDATAKVPPPG